MAGGYPAETSLVYNIVAGIHQSLIRSPGSILLIQYCQQQHKLREEKMALRQPTTTLALSTTFTAPASCAATHNIDILPSPGFLIYWNEPFPAPGVTASGCYPKEFLKSYTAVSPSAARALGSSVVPAMSPLACPDKWCTAYAGNDNYLACCPESYKFDTTTSALAVSSRPAYGGICYSDIAISQSETARIYDANGSSATQMWSASTSGAQAWAHPIDGWASSGVKVSVGCAAPSSSSSSSTSRNSKATTSSKGSSGGVSSSKKKYKKKKASGGAIAGAVIGAIIGLVAIIGAIVAFLKKRKAGTEGERDVEQEKVHEVEDRERGVHEAGMYNQAPQIEGSAVHQLKGGCVAAELDSPAQAQAQRTELPAGEARRGEAGVVGGNVQ
ncbi:hypothetical protein DPSP01_011626 [Paraphaeosphaeria sporulosa]